MRLINARNFVVESDDVFQVFEDEELPPYAILSHCWGKQEVSLPDLKEWMRERERLRDRNIAFRSHQSIDATIKIHSLRKTVDGMRSREGWLKIFNTCQKALDDHLNYVWVDTCCIDKSSSADLSEAINSMFRFYQQAKCCYVHLSDLHLEELTPSLEDTLWYDRLHACRWFTRGFTLQELLAPRKVCFYASDWKEIGYLYDHVSAVSRITKIDERVLLRILSLDQISVAKRMSWAANRQTSRVEDRAYSLLGIFDVNMPLLYGEKEKAFLRLQEEIIKTSTDQSIFAWQGSQLGGRRGSPVDAHRIERSLLASSPDAFSGSYDTVESDSGLYDISEMTKAGLSLWTHLISLKDGDPEWFAAVLNCRREQDGDHVWALSVRHHRGADFSNGQKKYSVHHGADNGGASHDPRSSRLRAIPVKSIPKSSRKMITIIRGSERPAEGDVVNISLWLDRGLHLTAATPDSFDLRTWGMTRSQVDSRPHLNLVRLWHRSTRTVILALLMKLKTFYEGQYCAGFIEDKYGQTLPNSEELRLTEDDLNVKEWSFADDTFAIRLPGVFYLGYAFDLSIYVYKRGGNFDVDLPP